VKDASSRTTETTAHFRSRANLLPERLDFLGQETIARATKWLRISGEFAAAQVLVSSFSVACGMIALWSLERSEFGILTTLYSAATIFSTLTDLGSTAALNSIGGPIAHEPTKYQALISAILRARLKLSAVALLLICPALAWLLLTVFGLSPFYVAVAETVFVLLCFFSLYVSTARAVELLAGNYKRTQSIDVAAAAVRLGLTALVVVVYPSAIGVFFAVVVGTALQYRLMSRKATYIVQLAAGKCPETAHDLWTIIRKLTPNSLYFAAQGQIGLLVLALFGSTSQVGDLGALARLSVISTLLTTVISSIIAPRFARSSVTPRLGVTYLLVMCAATGISSFLLAVVYIWPMTLLWLLGPHYRHLQEEIVLAMAIAAVSTVAGTMLSLNLARGWSRYYASLYVPVSVVCVIIIVRAVDVSSVAGALLLSGAGSLAITITCAADAIRALRGKTQDGAVRNR
jgi:O-antigen/teichoic acid export membrane protein